MSRDDDTRPREESTWSDDGDTRPTLPRVSGSLIRTVYDELHRVAEARLRRMRPGQTLQATDLVHEAFARLEKKPERTWKTRAEYFAAAACAMRDFHVDYIRRRAALRRGGDLIRTDVEVTFPEGEHTIAPEQRYSMLQALDQLQIDYPEHAELVLLQSYACLRVDEIVELVGLNKRTVERRLRFARAWMKDFMDADTASRSG